MINLRLGEKGSKRSLGLDIDSGYLAVAEVSGGRIERALSAELAPGLFADGEVGDEEALSGEIKDFFKRHELPRRVHLGVANQQIAVRSMELPAIRDRSELSAAVRFQAADTIAMPLDETVLDYQVVGETRSADGSPYLRVVVAAAREAMVLRLAETVLAAGLRPIGIDLSAFALVRTLARDSEAISIQPPTPHDGSAVERQAQPLAGAESAQGFAGSEPASSPRLVALDGSTDQVGGSESAPPAGGGEPAAASVAASPEQPSQDAPTLALAAVPPGSARVYCHLAGVTNLAVAVGSTCLFTRALSASRDASGQALPPALAEEIRLSIEFYTSQPGTPPVGELVLSGPGSTDDRLATELGQLVGFPARVAQPLRNLDASKLQPGEDPHRHTVAAGLALRVAA